MVARGDGDRVQRIALKDLQIVVENLDDEFFERVAAVELDVLQAVIHLEEHEGHDAGDVDLAVLRAEEILQVVVGQRRILGVNFAHNAHADLFDGKNLDAVK